jgi:exosortase/archaeosortase family protein
MGELYRLNIARRIATTLGGWALALAANLGRTTFLVCITHAYGFDALHRWHDTAGNSVILLVLPGVWALARLLRQPPGTPTAPDPSSERGTPADGSGPLIPATSQPGPQPQALNTASARPAHCPLWPWFLSVLWLGIVQTGVELWYRAHEIGQTPQAGWTVQWPAEQPLFRQTPLDDTARAMLRCDVGRGAAWADPAGHRWQAFFLRWEPGRSSAQLASGHTPDICLRGLGHKLIEDLGLQPAQAAGLTFPFRQYVFGQGSTRLHVFYCLWEDRAPNATAASASQTTRGGRLGAAIAGRRHRGQQVLSLAVEGPGTPEEARTALHRLLPGLVRTSPAPSQPRAGA